MANPESTPNDISSIYKIERNERSQLFGYIQERLDILCNMYGSDDNQIAYFAHTSSSARQLLEVQRVTAQLDVRGESRQRDFFHLETTDAYFTPNVVVLRKDYLAVDVSSQAFAWHQTYRRLQSGDRRFCEEEMSTGPDSPQVNELPKINSGNPVIFPIYNWQPTYYEDFQELRNKLEDLSYIVGALTPAHLTSADFYHAETENLSTIVP